MKRFKTDALNSLWMEVGDLSHPDYPFLDRNYSPASLMPVCDLTPYVTGMLLSGDSAALSELWSYIAHWDTLLELAMGVKAPKEMGLSEYASAELQATFLLTARISLNNGAAFVGADVAASILSTRDISLPGEFLSVLLSFLETELSHTKRYDCPELDINEKMEESLTALKQGTSGCETIAAYMKQVPPMVRITFSDVLNSGSTDCYSRHFHFGNGYDHRAYGCSREIGQQFATALGILEVPDVNQTGVSSSVTKPALISALSKQGIQVSKKNTRAELIRIASAVPGLLQEVQNDCDPDLLVLRQELAIEGREWAKRTKSLYWVSKALLAYMGMRKIGKRFPTTFSSVLDTFRDMAVGLQQHRESISRRSCADWLGTGKHSPNPDEIRRAMSEAGLTEKDLDALSAEYSD